MTDPSNKPLLGAPKRIAAAIEYDPIACKESDNVRPFKIPSLN